jgi:hypothetical protein
MNTSGPAPAWLIRMLGSRRQQPTKSQEGLRFYAQHREALETIRATPSAQATA